ncbi:hypothetical protein shim_29590 [Shimia sp. SK013]|nr:hypothetical protein shim_29590 [Shimia sp. SK013]
MSYGYGQSKAGEIFVEARPNGRLILNNPLSCGFDICFGLYMRLC